MQGFYALGYYFLRNYFKEFFWCWWYGFTPWFSFCASEKNMSLLLFERKHMNLRAHWSRNTSVEAHAISVSAIEFPSSSCIIYFLKYSVKLLPASFSLFVQVPVSIPRRFQSTGQSSCLPIAAILDTLFVYGFWGAGKGKLGLKPSILGWFSVLWIQARLGVFFRSRLSNDSLPDLKWRIFFYLFHIQTGKGWNTAVSLPFPFSFLIYHQFLALLSIQTRCWSL